jgi:hypothetical protein
MGTWCGTRGDAVDMSRNRSWYPLIEGAETLPNCSWATIFQSKEDAIMAAQDVCLETGLLTAVWEHYKPTSETLYITYKDLTE